MKKQLGNLSLMIIGLIIFDCIISAQESKINTIGINFGGSNFHILDKHANELIFKGTGLAPSIAFHHVHNKNVHILEGSFYYNDLSSYTANYKTKMFAGEMRYCYLRTFLDRAPGKNQFIVSGGMALTSFYMKTNYQVLKQTYWITAIESWYWSHSIDVAVQFNYALGGSNTFTIWFVMPFISNVSRPKYSSSGDYNYDKNGPELKAYGNTMIIPQNLLFDTRLSYERTLNGRISLTAVYQFVFASSKKPDLLKLYMNNLRIGLLYHF